MPNDSEEEIQGVSCSFHDVGFHVRGGQRHVYSEPAMWCLLVVVEDLVLLIVQSYLRHLFGKRCEFKYSRFFYISLENHHLFIGRLNTVRLRLCK